jgi:hypothetical protein
LPVREAVWDCPCFVAKGVTMIVMAIRKISHRVNDNWNQSVNHFEMCKKNFTYLWDELMASLSTWLELEVIVFIFYWRSENMV